MSELVWLAPPFGQGEPKQVEAKPELIVPLLVAGWSQCEPPTKNEEVTENVHD
ncbi:MAG: hypothetical protein KIT09_31690 [Bryobacteraceae bacterium]|nr:hypothetical protein [Bryobacteraceae bacterium]